MTYEWKLPGIIPVDAQVAGEEFSRIYAKNGKLDADDVVEESKPKGAPLHDCFEWNDKEAAKEYRRTQAMTMIRMITVKMPLKEDEDPIPVRAYVSIKKNAYQPISVVLTVPDMHAEMLAAAKRELQAFQAKYDTLEELQPVFDAIRKVSA